MMGRMLIPLVVLALLAPPLASATGSALGIRLEILAPVRIEVLATGAIAAAGSATVTGKALDARGASMAGAVSVTAPEQATVSILPATVTSGDPALPGYRTVTILVQ
jgi:hypothetical protein